ncbi:dihydroxyacetone kinase subunit L [Rhodovibrio sodomensis]|uniref:Dihydroxyacetone kinase subunit L n=1 Tax=Rhodovibrio sodomensis TaxID=1088 RepID=A0ABS1DJF6_9PROT|nr:dihydroxyacetone kinase subunit DhaL [Rhodovibrio sodomensis]MBK1670636.1 dihydroxyacetone kinase subunit L [Rhodovibrio sodomensis]
MPADATPPAWHRAAIDACVATIAAEADTLTELDSAIGDGDHGTNLKRGFDALAAEADTLADQPTGAMLQRAGTTLANKVGGASGALYGSLLMMMGRQLGGRPLDPATLAEALGQGVEMVKKRGRAEAGEKTLLDVLVPVQRELDRAVDAGEGDRADLAHRLRACADNALESTRAMTATKGRASYLGERSAGHLDPGAASACLLIGALADLAEDRT